MDVDAPPAASPGAEPTPSPGAAPAPDDGARPKPFAPWLALIAAIALGVRLVYAVGWRFDTGLQYDGPVYAARARFLLEGQSFKNPDAWFFRGVQEEGAVHPAGNTFVLALARQLGFDTDHRLQVWGCLLGVLVLVAVALLGREVGGRAVGLVAAAIVAVHPGFWSYDPTAMAETPGQLATAVTLLLGYRFWRMPSTSRAAWLGAAGAAAAMMRSELVILLPLLVLPLCVTARGTGRQVLVRCGAAVLWAAMVLGPWVGWNLVRFEHPTTLATGVDLSLAYGQCDDVWFGPNTGYWNLFCATRISEDPANRTKDESEVGKQYRAQAGRYIAQHKGRWPIVLAHRAGRTLSVYPPVQQIDVEHERESRELPVLWAATIATWCTYLLAIVAFVRPQRSRRYLLPLLTPLAAGVAGAVITFGTSRYRSAGEVGLVVLAAIGIDAILGARNASASRRSTADAIGPDPAGHAAPSSGRA
jgi:4-amino-4-deoxy-L-arabinose transferase-like glycosyltransferase